MYAPQTNYRLKQAIASTYGKQWVFARNLGIDPSYVSKVVVGCRALSQPEMERWAAALGVEPEIFDVERKA